MNVTILVISTIDLITSVTWIGIQITSCAKDHKSLSSIAKGKNKIEDHVLNAGNISSRTVSKG